MLILLNAKCEIHTGHDTKDYFYWNIHIVAKRQPFQIFLRMLAAVILVYNHQVYVGLVFLIILAIFNLSGKIPVESDWFEIKVIGDSMRGQI